MAVLRICCAFRLWVVWAASFISDNTQLRVNSCVMPFIFQSVSFVSFDLNSYNGRVPGNTLRTGHTYKHV